MKKFKKLISLALAAVLLISGSAIARADSISISEELTLTGLNDASVTQAVENYFDERADYLLGDSAAIDGTVVGIVNDEAAHMEQYADENIALTASVYEIESVECYDTCAEVTVTETIAYTRGGSVGTEEVAHSLNVYLNGENVPVVAADAYIELCSGFVSCSYVAPSVQTYSTTSTAGGSGLCVVNIAQGEVGYTETSDNITKYGSWYGADGSPWCAMFVSWCANKANVSASIIKKAADCDVMREFFADQGVYYASAAYSGSYTPKVGDIFFKGTVSSSGKIDATHVGYVVSVSSSSFMVVDGNCNNQVRYHSESLTASDVLGFAHPDYESSGHVASTYTVGTSTHSGTCANCSCEFEEAHTSSAIYSTNASYHWKTCTVCKTVYNKSAHVMALNSLGVETCKTCGYQGVSVIV